MGGLGFHMIAGWAGGGGGKAGICRQTLKSLYGLDGLGFRVSGYMYTNTNNGRWTRKLDYEMDNSMETGL